MHLGNIVDINMLMLVFLVPTLWFRTPICDHIAVSCRLLCFAMAPKTVKSSASKASKSVQKDVPLKKGKKSASSGDSKPKLSKQNLEKGDLVGPGPLTLREKVNKVLEDDDSQTPEEAAFKLRDKMTKLDKSIVWGQYNTHLKHHPDEKKSYDAMTSLEKGNAQALWFIRKSSPKFCSFKMSISGSDKITRDETWKTYKEMIEKFGEDEFKAHLERDEFFGRKTLSQGVCGSTRIKGLCPGRSP